jgi:hypothetical protein
MRNIIIYNLLVMIREVAETNRKKTLCVLWLRSKLETSLEFIPQLQKVTHQRLENTAR